MLKELISSRTINNQVAGKAAGWWGKMLLDPYKYIYSGNVKVKLYKENSLSVEQVMIFESLLKKMILKDLKHSNGLVNIHCYDENLKDIAMAARIPDFPDSYFPKGANMYIDSILDENNPEIYVYIEGMDNSKKIC